MNAEVKARNAAAVHERRQAEQLDAWDFLVNGAEGHAEICVHALSGGEACSRDYDPLPTFESLPDVHLYEGTGIGALYGLPGSECHLWQLAGWNVLTSRKETP